MASASNAAGSNAGQYRLFVDYSDVLVWFVELSLPLKRRLEIPFATLSNSMFIYSLSLIIEPVSCFVQELTSF